MLSLKEKRQSWRKIVLQWKESNKSINSWCREKNIPPSTFSYWKNIFFPKSAISFSKNSFTEIIKDNSNPKVIEMEIKGIIIRVNKDFDQETLKRCILITRSL
jgi:hypothetical protein